MKYLKQVLGILGGLCAIPIIVGALSLLVIILSLIVLGVFMFLSLGFFKVIFDIIGFLFIGFVALIIILGGYFITVEFLENHFKFFKKDDSNKII